MEEEEAKEAFYNRGLELEELREKNQRDYKKICFISESDSGRLLKLVLFDTDELVLLSAFEPSAEDVKKYETECEKVKAARKR